MRSLFLVIVCMLGLVACTADSAVDTPEGSGADPACPTEGEELETAKLYIEHNATDADTGVHGLFGGEAWSELCIWDPAGNLIFVIDPRSQLGDLTVADLFFESREPPNDEYSMDDLFTDFPEGTYLAGGTDFEGTPRVGTASFTHAIPAEPVIVSPALGGEEDPASTPIAGLVVSWEPVTETILGDPVIISGYEVIVTKVEHEDPDGLSRPIYDVHLDSEARSLEVPETFLELGTLYELEVLALEQSGNQTIGLGFFVTSG